LENEIFRLFQIVCLPQIDMVSKHGNIDKFACVEEFIIMKGGHPTNFDSSDFILTATFKKLVKRLASIVSVTDYAVILEGPTSAGKTSTV
jgi:midasin (ATPase involved in ribosome maturation)